jgi:hypothetical protein
VAGTGIEDRPDVDAPPPERALCGLERVTGTAARREHAAGDEPIDPEHHPGTVEAGHVDRAAHAEAVDGPHAGEQQGAVDPIATDQADGPSGAGASDLERRHGPAVDEELVHGGFDRRRRRR